VFCAACCSIDDENRRIDPDLVADEDMTRNGQTERARGSAQQQRIHDDEHEGDDLKRATCAAGEGLVQEDQACGDRDGVRGERRYPGRGHGVAVLEGGLEPDRAEAVTTRFGFSTGEGTPGISPMTRPPRTSTIGYGVPLRRPLRRAA
jgi:hypothetical protein